MSEINRINKAKKLKSAFIIIIFLLSFSLSLSVLAFSNIKSASAHDSGKYLFRYYNCLDCHAINGVGGTLGPSLSNYGNEGKSYAWIVSQIKNPRTHFKTGSEIKINGKDYYALMPSYNYVPSSDIERIASYLESLKK